MRAEWTANESLQAEINARNEADTQRRVADEQRKLTQVQKERADASAAKAETERDAKGLALERAEALRLTAQSSAILSSNPGLALLLAIEGAKRARPRLATHNNALLAALNECRERRTILASSLDPGTEHGAILSGLCISHDGRLLATTSAPQSRGDFVSNDNAARVFSAATGAQVSFFRVAGLIPSSCEFSPDDRLVVSTFEGAALINFKDGARRIYSDRAARVWDTATGREVAVLKGHADRVISAHFSSDGSRIVSASWDGTARVWDTRTGQSLAILRCGQLGLASASFSPDASRILTVSSSSGISRKTTVGETHRDIEWDPPLRRDPLEAQVMQLAFSTSSTTPFGPGYGVVRIWNAASGSQLYVLEDKAETGAVCAAFSPDGRQVATGLWRGTIKIWDAQTGTLARSWKGPTQRICSVAYSPDGNRLLLVYGDVMENRTSLAVWSALDGREIIRWGEASFPTGIGTAQLSPDARQVLVLPGDAQHKGQPKTVSLRSVTEAAGAEGDVTIFKGQEGKVAAVQFNSDGREAVTAGSDGTLRIWTCRGPGNYGTLLDSSSGPIGQAAFDSKGRFVLTTYGLDRSGGIVDSNRSVRLWDVRSRGLLQTIKPGLPPHPGPASAAFLRALQAFVNPAHVADMPMNPFFEQLILGEILHAEFSRDGNRVLTISDDSHVQRHVDSPPKQSKQQGDDDVPGTPIQTLRSGADVEYGPVRVWDVGSGKRLIQLKGFTANVRSASLSPDGRRIVTVADDACKYLTLDSNDAYRSSGWKTAPKDAAIRVWNAETGRQIAALVGPANRAYGAAWSPDGRFLFSATSELSGTIRIRLWDAQTLNSVRDFKASTNTLGWSAGQPLFSPDSRHLILLRTDGDSKVATIWDVDRAAGPVELRGHVGRINDGAFNPTGSRVVTASDDGTARVWYPATGAQVLVLRGHESGLHSAQFSPDSRWIVTASSDATARVWYAETAREYLTLASHRGPVLEASFSPDSQSVVTAPGDGTARIWPIDPLPVAISRRPRDFTTREREMFEVGR
jgi:WD40 repeat protein